MTSVDNQNFSKLDWLKRTNGHKFSGSEFRVLVAIYNHTNADGKSAYPGLKLLIKETGYVQSAVSAAITSLKARGWIHEVSRGSNLTGRNSKYDLIPEAPCPPGTSSPEELHVSSPEEVRVSSPEETNQILVSDPLTDPRELQVLENLKHGENLVGGSLEGHHLPVEVEVLKPAASSGKDDPWGVPIFLLYGTPEWEAEQLASAIPWPSNKPLPKPGDPSWCPWTTYKDETTGELIR